MNRNPISTIAGLIVWMFLVSAGPAYSDDPPLKAELAGDIITLESTAVSNIGRVTAAYNGTDDEFRVVWNDSRITGQNDVYTQRLDADGTLLGTNVTIVSGEDSSSESSIAHDPVNNQYLIVWKNQSGGPGTPGFNHSYGGIASAQGGLIGRVTDYSNAGLEGSIAYNGTDGEFLITARNFAGGGTAGIYGRRVDTAGNAIGGNVIISTTGAPAPSGQVCYNPNANQFLSTFRNQSNSTLEGRIINADGTFASPIFEISTMFPESGMAAGVAFDPVNDRYLVAFSEFCCSGVYGQFVAPDGTLVGGAFTVFPPNGHRLQPLTAYDPVNSVYLVAWSDSDTGKIYLQLLNDDGSNAGESLAVPNPGSASGPPHVKANTDQGGFIVVWRDNDYGISEYHVMAQFIAVVPCLLVADNASVPEAGGSVNFTLDAGVENAGDQCFLMCGLLGTSPGTTLPGGLVVPCNWDPVVMPIVRSLNNIAIFFDFIGTLDGNGQAFPRFEWPGYPGSAGLIIYFAGCTIYPFDFVTNSVEIEVVP